MGIKFDNTINVSNWLTAISLVIGGAGVGMTAYSSMDKRVTVLETERINERAMQSERTLNQQATLTEIKADLKELTKAVNQLKEQRK